MAGDDASTGGDGTGWFADALEAMAEGVVLRDHVGRPVYVNARAEELLGLSRTEIFRRELDDDRWQAYALEGAPLASEEYPAFATLRTGAPVAEAFVGVPRPEGGMRWLSINIVPFTLPGWPAPGALSTFRDATELKVGRDIDRAVEAMANAVVRAAPGASGDALAEVLDHVGRVTGADLLAYVVFDRDEGVAHPLVQWRAATERTGPVPGAWTVPLDQIVWLLGRLRRDEPVVFADTGSAPDESVFVANGLAIWGARSAVLAPVVVGGRLAGTVVVGWDRTGEPDDRMTRFLLVASELVAALFERERAHDELRALNDQLDARVRDRSADLEREQERSRALVAALPDLLFELDADGMFLDVHAPDERILAAPPEVFLGRRVRDVLDDDLAHRLEDALARVLASAVGPEVLEYTLPLDGVDRTFECRLAPMSGDRVLAIVRDVTEDEPRHQRGGEEALLAVANEELRQAVVAKDEFLATMSHELRTPLSAILGMSEILLDGTGDPLTSAQADALATIESSGRRLLALVDDLLDLSRLERDAESVHLEPVDAHEVARLAVELVRSRAVAKDLSVEFTIAGRATVLADERRLRQVLLNLLDNAVKFTPPGGGIGLAVAPDGAVVTLTVWDTGIGIAGADQGRVFEPFLQVDATTARRYEGSGLGLAIADRLVRLQGGSIGVESSPGEGSRFTVTLPSA